MDRTRTDKRNDDLKKALIALLVPRPALNMDFYQLNV